MNNKMTLDEYKAQTEAKFEKIFLVPFSWMEVSDSDLDLAHCQGRSPKDFALDIGLGFGFRPSIPD